MRFRHGGGDGVAGCFAGGCLELYLEDDGGGGSEVLRVGWIDGGMML